MTPVGELSPTLYTLSGSTGTCDVINSSHKACCFGIWMSKKSILIAVLVCVIVFVVGVSFGYMIGNAKDDGFEYPN